MEWGYSYGTCSAMSMAAQIERRPWSVRHPALAVPTRKGKGDWLGDEGAMTTDGGTDRGTTQRDQGDHEALLSPGRHRRDHRRSGGPGSQPRSDHPSDVVRKGRLAATGCWVGGTGHPRPSRAWADESAIAAPRARSISAFPQATRPWSSSHPPGWDPPPSLLAWEEVN